MLAGRGEEIHFLEQFYEKQGSQIVVIYGQRNVGKTRLIKEFMEDKPHFYYACRECSEREQQYQWNRELVKAGENPGQVYGWQELFAGSLRKLTGKQVLVLDEFQYVVKCSDRFMEELVAFVNSRAEHGNVLVILASSSISWVENSMVRKMGGAALGLSSLLKIRPLDFFKLRRAFPGYAAEDAICLYAVLGGFPGLWRHMSPEKNLQENICEAIISPMGALYGECRKLLSEELRELAVYHTILSALAGGLYKLNDIYVYTGFSRAKISVYLKNLMELELVEKVFSYDTEGREHAQKGIYRICNPLVRFYFTYLYFNQSRLEMEEANVIYKSDIYSTLRQYASPCFREICQTYLLQEDVKPMLPYEMISYGEWVGKDGNIDIIMQSGDGRTLVAGCNFEKPLMFYEDYEQLLFLAGQAKLKPDDIWLFSSGRFDERLYLEERMKKNMRLLLLQDIMST